MGKRRRWVRKLLLALGAVVLLVLLVLGFALATTSGLRLVLALGVPLYERRIAGAISVEGAEGRLLGRFTLRGVVLSDRAGRALVTAEAIAVEWSPWALLGGEVRVDALRVERPHVHLVGDDAGGFADLAPPGPDVPEDRSAPPGPDLPLALDVTMRVRDGVIHGADGVRLAEAIELDARLRGSGRAALVDVMHGSARVNGAPPIRELRLRARWASPVAALDASWVRFDGAELFVPEARFDVRRLRGWARLRAAAAVPVVAGLLPSTAGETLRRLGSRVELEAAAEGDPEDMWAEAQVRTANAELTLTGTGAWHETPRADVSAVVDADLGPWTDGLVGRVRPTLSLRLRERDEARLDLAGELRCAACDGLGEVSLAVDGVLERHARILSLETSMSLAGMSASAEVRAASDRLYALEWRLEAPALARTATIARRFFPTVPAVRGALTGRGACAGSPVRCHAALELRRLAAAGVSVGHARVDIDVLGDMSQGALAVAARDVRQGRRSLERAELALAVVAAGTEPVPTPLGVELPPLRARLRAAASDGRAGAGERARVDLSVTTGRAVGVDLDALELEVGRTRIALEQPARALLRARSLEVDRLRLAVGGGRVALHGIADLDGPSDLRLDVDDVRLASLEPLAPGLRPAGLASADVYLRGRPESLTFRADLGVRGAGLRGLAIGDIGLAASLADDRASVAAGLRGPLARRAALRAEFPLRLNLSRGAWSIGDEGARALLQVEALQLRRLTRWIPGLQAGGRVDGVLRYDGDDRVALTGAWRGHGLSLAEVPLGRLELSLAQRDERLRGRATLVRAGGRARLEFALPVALDVPHATVAWRREQEHRASLRVEELDLAAQLDSVLAHHHLDGRVSAAAELSGPATAPEIEARARVKGLRIGDMSFGTYRMSAAAGAGGTTIELGGEGPVGRLALQGFAPIHVGVGRRVWRPDGWYALELDVQGFDLAALRALAGLEVDGRTEVHLRLVGPGEAPQALGAVVVDDLAYEGAPLGNLRADLALRDGTATLTGQGRVGRCGELYLDARAPLDVDLDAPAVAWGASGPSSLHLDLTGVDPSLFDSVDALPRDTLADLDLHARVDIDREQLRAHASLTGALGRPGLGTTPVALRLDVDDFGQRLRGDFGWRDGAPSLALALDADAAIPAVRRGQAELLSTPIHGALQARGTDLRYLSGLLPDALHDLRGLLDADLAIDGKIAGPVVRGEAHLRDGAVTVVALQQRFQDVVADLRAADRELRVDRLVATSGEGRIQATGSATLPAKGGLVGAGRLSLKDFPVVRPGWPQMTVDARAKADLVVRPDELSVGIRVAGAEVWVSDLTTPAPAPIPENENVTIVSGPFDAFHPADEHEAAAGLASASEADGERDLSFSVELAQPMHIQGPSMDMRWSGRVRSRSEDGESRVSGQLRADRGRFELLGTMFRIEQGRVFLPEGGDRLDPFLDLIAEARTPQADVTVTLRGRLSRPELHLRSQPPLTEPQIFSLLVSGSADSNETDPRKAQASAAGLLVNFSNPTLARFAESRLGIDRIKLGFAADITQPVLTVGKHLSKSIYVETTYHHNAPPRQNRIEAQVEYRFAPGWSVETFFGDAAVGGLDVFWRHRFGRPRRAPPP
ncbi:translocation/assembly module TamB [Nannocystis pusilla]|uniref:Translocation/assembly module TamB n=1 Tax=Nannocystis pusilla TaxID=889268 RepID=A0ABS7U5L6_9BACT|nr:translocation/assembly module TamB [Nannocystis pusilla]MBZ5715704.1 translocation/assembly module TamB [Nannocystis pusilla]